MVNGGYKNDLNLDEKVMMAVVRLAEFFKKNSANIFKNYGLTFPQYNVLRVLDSSENRQNTISNVGKIMLVSGANMTGIAKRLEKNGFLLRKSDPRDERVTLLKITPKGREQLKNISSEKDANIARYLEHFSDEQKKEVLALLRSVIRETDLY
ncbi:transcriptional regulator, MarR family [delta proteobacterium NaphS2]|nr:transcriptional regulator, MarR family [delta proteobacterium NaphS2]